MRLKSLLFRLAFAAARCPLTSPHAATRRPILQKARGHRRRNGSRCLGAHGFRRCFTPSRGAFHLSLAVLVRYRSSESVQPGGWSPCFGPGFHVLRPYSDRRPQSSSFAYGASPAAAGLPCRSARTWFFHGRGLGAPGCVPQHRIGNGPSLGAVSGLGSRAFAAATRAISVDFSSSGTS